MAKYKVNKNLNFLVRHLDCDSAHNYSSFPYQIYTIKYLPRKGHANEG